MEVCAAMGRVAGGRCSYGSRGGWGGEGVSLGHVYDGTGYSWLSGRRLTGWRPFRNGGVNLFSIIVLCVS